MNLIVTSIFYRSFLQILRNRFSLALTILTTPFFLILYWLVFVGSNSARIGIFMEADVSSKSPLNSERSFAEVVSELKREMDASTSRNPITWIELEKIPNTKTENSEGNTSGDSFEVLLTFKRMQNSENPKFKNSYIEISNDGKLSSILLSYKIKDFFLDQVLGNYQLPIQVHLQKTDLDLFQFSNFAVGFIVFAMIMMIFSSSQSIAVEIETNTWIRYRLANLPITSYLLGMSSVQLFFGMISILISYLCIVFLRVDLSFHFFSFIAICTLGLAVHIQIGFCLAGIFKNTMLVFLGSSFVMFLLLLFSGIVFPSPPNLLISEGHSIDFFGMLPSAIVKKLLDLTAESSSDRPTFYNLLIQIFFYWVFLLLINSYLLRRLYTIQGTD
ncbi:MAG: ABC transporter permease [Leptospira sp.]|nr:ABC transporter permease [Leptospira sp.]